MSYLSKEEYSLKRYFQEALLDYLSSPNIFSALNFNQISVKNLYALNDLNNPYYQNGLLIPSILTKILDVINLQSLNKNFNLILFSCIDILFFRDDEINEKFVFNGTNDNEYYNNEQLMLYNFKKDYIKTFVKYLNLVKYEEKNLFNELIIIIKKYKDISIIFNYYYYNLLSILENNEITNFYEIFLLLHILYKKYLYSKSELFNYFNKVKYYNPKIFSFFMDELNEIFSYIFNNNFINNSINNDNNLINSIRNDLQIKINLIKYLCLNNPDHIDNTIDEYLKLLEDNNINNNNNNMINPNNANRFRNEEFINLVSNYFESGFILNDMETIINRENPYYIRNSYKYNNNNDHLNNAIRKNDNKKRHRKRYENFSLNYNINDKMNLLGIDNFEDEVREGYNLKIFMNNFDNLSLQDKKDCINSDLDFINEKINKAVKKNCDIETFNILNKYKNEIVAKAEEYLNKTYKRNTLNYKNLTYNPMNNNYNNNLYNNKTLKNRTRTLKTSMSDFGINNNNNMNNINNNENDNNITINENDINKNVNDSNNNSIINNNNNSININNSGIKNYSFNNSGINANFGGGSIYLLNSFNKLNKSNNSIVTNKSSTNKDNNFNSSEKKKK